VFNALPPPLNFAVPFVIVLGVLVFVHELGHYLAARWRGVFVETFSIGFGRALATWTDRRGTVWKVGWLPLGGYVKMHGQEQPADVTPEVRAAWQAGRTFHEKSVGSRAIVVAAGPFANFLLAAVLFAGLYATAGVPTTLPVVGQVLANSAAARAGLQTGDRIESIDAHPVSRFEDIQRTIAAHPEQRLTLQVRRGDSSLSIPVTTEARDSGGGRRIGTLGITAKATEFRRLSPGAAVIGGVAQTWDVTEQTLVGVWQMITGSRGTADLGGPLRIAQLSGEVAQSRPDQSVPDPDSRWRPLAVLPGRGHPGTASVVPGDGIRHPRRLRPSRRPVRLCHLERSLPTRTGSLGCRPDRLSEAYVPRACGDLACAG